ncbi:MAG: alpha/beta hydrolase [Clostridiales bacterium]|nr:alpha/beta hydrolase [Clostridiales bacterium]
MPVSAPSRPVARGVELRHVELPRTTLRVGIAGDGPPLIMLPATISLIEDWEALIRFVGQSYSAHFFELPGHGGSSPLDSPYRSELIAESVVDLADKLGFDTFSLFGFSFGGLLALRTLQHAGDRIERVALFSPYIGREALLHSRAKLLALRVLLTALKPEIARRGVLGGLSGRRGSELLAWFMHEIGKFETSADLTARLRSFTASSVDVLIAQVNEVLTTPAASLAGPFASRCLFGMSMRDPMLDYSTTRAFLTGTFPDISEERWDTPYHAAPRALTFEDYERDHRSVLTWR